MTSKTIHTTYAVPVTAVVLASLLFVPFVSFAQTSNRTTGDAKFCSSLPSIEDKIISTLVDRLKKAETRYDAHLDTLEGKRDAALAQLESKRDQVDVKWEQQIAQLKAKAKTDAQTTAINEYESTVEQLMETRRAAVDTAVDTFVIGVSDLRDGRAADYSAMLTAHKADMEAAFAAAEAACEQGTDPATARQELKDELETIREAFKAERIEYTKRDEFNVLREARKSATEEAGKTFRAGLKEANQKLKAALGTRS